MRKRMIPAHHLYREAEGFAFPISNFKFPAPRSPKTPMPATTCWAGRNRVSRFSYAWVVSNDYDSASERVP